MYFLKPYQGREVLFVDGANNNEMMVLEAGWKRNLGKMNLDPNGMVAMRGQKHPITEVGIRNLVGQANRRQNRRNEIRGMQRHQQSQHARSATARRQ